VTVQEVLSAFWQLPVALHALHGPQPAAGAVQQTLSVQVRPAAHCPSPAHIAPAGFLPQMLPTHVLGETQSVLSAHVWLQALLEALHKNGPHELVEPPTLQLPAPSQVFASVTDDMPAGHEGPWHCVPATHFWHAPLPSHLPSLPQLDAAETPQVPLGSVALTATGEHVPIDAVSVHDTQGPLHTALQQTFCAEHTRPVWHSAEPAHVPPGGLRPHEPLEPHVAFGAQSAFDLHAELQTFVPQPKGKQDFAAGVAHVPAPSHVEPAVKVIVPVGHVEPLQEVPAAYFWQAPATHLPFVPHEAPPWSTHSDFGSTVPVGTFVHVPSDVGRLHDLHEAAHVVTQHTPCAQTFDAHSVPAEQLAPGPLRPHELTLQTFGEMQFVFTVQDEKHFEPLHANGAHGSDDGATH